MNLRYPLAQLFTASLLFFSPIALKAEVICDFASQTEESLVENSPNAFPGSAGEGWQGPWEGRRYLVETVKNKKYQSTLEGVSLAQDQGKNGKRFLQVAPLPSGPDLGAGIARAYQSHGDLNLTKPYVISCTIRFDKLPNKSGKDLRNQFLFIGENGTTAIGTTTGTSWFLQAFYGRKKDESVIPGQPEHRFHAALQQQWNLGTLAKDTQLSYLPTGVQLKEGVEYHLAISIDPASSSYHCEIKAGGATFSSDTLKFQSKQPLGRNIVIGSMHAKDDPATFSVGNLRISKKQAE